MRNVITLYYIQFKEAKILWGPWTESQVPDMKARDRITQTPDIIY